MQAHFHAAAELYHRWSPEGHLHFGYWGRACRAAALTCLARLVDRVMAEMSMPGDLLADLDARYGAAARHGEPAGAPGSIPGFTVVPEQVQEGRVRILADGLGRSVDHVRDFRNTGLGTGSVDGAFRPRGMCYASRPDKPGPGWRNTPHPPAAWQAFRGDRRFRDETAATVGRDPGCSASLFRLGGARFTAPPHPPGLEGAGFPTSPSTDLSFQVAPGAFAPWWSAACCWTAGWPAESFDAGERARTISLPARAAPGRPRGTVRYLLIGSTRVMRTTQHHEAPPSVTSRLHPPDRPDLPAQRGAAGLARWRGPVSRGRDPGTDPAPVARSWDQPHAPSRACRCICSVSRWVSSSGS